MTYIRRKPLVVLDTIKENKVTRRSFLSGTASIFIGSFLDKVFNLFPATPFLQVGSKRIYLAPDDHTDYFWSADDVTYQQAFLNMLDYYLNQADATAGNLSQYQSRFNCDGSFWVWVYERNRTTTQFQRLMNRIKDGHIGMPLNALCVCQGGAPAEAVLRGMYYPGQLERRFNHRFLVAYEIENQTIGLGLGALWSGAGAKYSWKGVCGCDTLVPAPGDRQHDIYWWVGIDGSRILMKWNSMLNGNQSMGGYAEAFNPIVVVDQVEQNTFTSRYTYPVIGAFGQGWDNIQTTDQACVTAAINKTTASRQVIVSNEADFFQDFETNHGANIPSLTSSFGNEWDLYAAVLAEVSARFKRTVEKLRSAEALATLVTLKTPTFVDSRKTTRDQAWMNMGLFFEHNFGTQGASPQLVQGRINWQKNITTQIESYVNQLYSDSVSALGGLIQKTGTNQRFYVFNSLSWTRTDIADFPYTGATPVHVVDLSTGTDTPSQLVTINGQQYLRILAQNIPSVGYKVFEIQSGVGQNFSSGAPTASGSLLSNYYYQVTVSNRGAITSLSDVLLNRQFAQTIGGLSINDLGSGTGTIATENVGAVSATLKVVVPGTGTLARTTRITLFRDVQRVDIRNEITQNFDATNTWRFTFSLTNPDLHHEEVGAILLAKKVSQGGHYSDRTSNSRYDWLTLNHFADLSDATFGVILSNADCYFMKRGTSTVGTLDTTSPYLQVLVGGHVVNGGNGLANQGGDTNFLQRFALQTHGAYNQVSAMKFALEHQNPLVTGTVTGGSAYPATSFSLLTISNANVLLWALKPADDGIQSQGVIARVWNVASSPSTFSLTLPPNPITSAQQTTHIETPLGTVTVSNGAITDTLTTQQIKTFSLMTSGVGSGLQTPANLTANALSKTQISLIWNDTSSVESDFHIERSPNGSTGWTEIGTVGTNVNTFIDFGLACDTPYYYRVRAHRQSDNQFTDYSNIANATTQSCTGPIPDDVYLPYAKR